ncbi:hypothetical protein C8J57DRAFT_1070333, partial [Mycena rebaudengoi]
DDYETILSALATNIQKRQTLLSEIRLREHEKTMLVTLYAIVVWLAYLAVWYFGFVSVPRGTRSAHGRARGTEQALRALPVFVGPICILSIRRIVQPQRQRRGEILTHIKKKTLQNLLKEQRAKVEEIKKKTNYYSTRELLSRYDDSAPNSPQQQLQTQTPQRGRHSTHLKYIHPAPRPSPLAPTPALQPLQPLQPLSPLQPQRPAQRKWYDALADVLVGVEDGPGPASQKYALICEKCFAHNGLMPAVAFPDAQYKCPQCGHFNASARSKALHSPATPTYGPTQAPAPTPIPRGAPSRSSASASTRPSMSADAVRRRGGSGDGSGGSTSGSGEDGELMEVDS